MNIHQILPNFAYGDAIGVDTLALKKILRSLGYNSNIYADIIHPKLQNEAIKRRYHKDQSDSKNLLIYHFSVGSEITEYVMSVPDRLIIIFHNITPANWFFGNSPHMTEVTAEGMDELIQLKDRCMVAWADSEYNASILREAGYDKVHVLPIIVEFSRLKIKADTVFKQQWSSPFFTWTFVGRLSPNKRHQDIIRAFAWYKQYLNPRSRLLLIGENRNCWRYTYSMTQLVKSYSIEDVVFSGSINDSELAAAYNLTDVFICMSEHEGFCVPLLEAMHFNIPVIAFDAGAVSETLGGSGLVLKTKNPVEVAELVELIRSNKSFRTAILAKQQKRLHEFCTTDMTVRIKKLLEEIL